MSESDRLTEGATREWQNVRRLVDMSRGVISDDAHAELVNGVVERTQSSQQALVHGLNGTPISAAPDNPVRKLSQTLDDIALDASKAEPSAA